MIVTLLSLFMPWISSAQDLSVCDGKGREQCMWALTCAKDPKNPNKVIPSDCAQHYKEPEQAPAPAPVAVTPPPAKKEKSPLEKLYYIDVDEDEQERIMDERSRRQAERAVNSEESKDTSPKKSDDQKQPDPVDKRTEWLER